MTIRQSLQFAHHERHAIGRLHRLEEADCTGHDGEGRYGFMHTLHHRSGHEERITRQVEKSHGGHEKCRQRERLGGRHGLETAWRDSGHDEKYDGQKTEYHVHRFAPGPTVIVLDGTFAGIALGEGSAGVRAVVGDGGVLTNVRRIGRDIYLVDIDRELLEESAPGSWGRRCTGRPLFDK